ncbi:hypothetical protein SDC9_194893 [bioreactor metagenome]|uniref:N-acetyltransferase domain-containing protein n=1 Tax=bioreactor metagenome TaxID=1076179 RepID=A0A645I7J5_9ZZZZ
MTDIDYGHKSAEIGYFLAPEKQDGGLGLNFVFSSLLFCFDIIGMKLLKGNVMKKNKVACLLNLFLGFKQIKEYEQLINDQKYLFQYCEITKNDFYTELEQKNRIENFIKYYTDSKKT